MPRHHMDSLASVPLPQEANVISSILTEFGHFSGHRVNIQKSQIYFSPNTNPATIVAICSYFTIAQTSTLGKADISVWNDTWVPSLGPLRPWLLSWSRAVASLTFDDLLQNDRQWNVNRLSVLLLPEAIPFFIGIPPTFEDACDALSWNSTSTGIFSVASAYAHFLESVWEAIDPKWSWVWSLVVTSHIRMFIWLILKQHLMTNEEHCRRGLSSYASCPCCGCVSESIIHILRNCSPTRALWHSIIPQECQASFFTAPLESWVVSNIRDKLVLGDSSTPWACFFPTLLWQLWKRRNDFFFTDIYLPLVEVYKIALTWAKHFAEINVVDWSHAASMVTYLQWKPPAPGWVCLNVDSSISPTTELWSVFVGLQVARSSGVDRLIVQSDRSHAIKLLLNFPQHGHRMPLVRAIGLLRHGSWHVDFQWIPRELNMVADCLSKLPSPPQFSLLVTTDITELARPFLDRDREGPPYSRHSRGVS
ncbi:hypothetical protein V6N11_056958 [Hibiscus sabdariffa]|uniref:Reverse transcriptase zinc-binding domain-containing protein n=1 Tax=Hibiscus sabdariffa TaxID=183260 RepID=A0ABR2T5B6_9ROSI